MRQACQQWRLPLHAHLSHISSTPDGRSLIVSTSADHKHEGRLRYVRGSSGKVKWLINLKQPVRQQTIAASGDLLAVNTYDGKLSLYNSAGKKLWEHDHLGRPVIFPKTRHVVLLNDDDSEPKVAFTTYDFSGKRVAVVAADHEPLDMDTPENESFVALATTDRQLSVYTPLGKLLARASLPGDSISLKVTADRIFALTSQPSSKVKQSLTAYALNAKRNALEELWSRKLDRKYEAVRVSGEFVFLYGNTYLGQALAAHHAKDGGVAWKRSYSNPASYSSMVYASSNSSEPFMTAAVDEVTPAGVLHVMAINGSGEALWDAAVAASNGIYSYAFAEAAPAVAVGAGEPGDGTVIYYRISDSECHEKK